MFSLKKSSVFLLEKWQTRESYSTMEEENITPLPLAWLSAGILCFIAAVIFRSWENLTHPGFYAEDSIHYFNTFYGDNQPLSKLFFAPHGYPAILNNLAALLIAKIDILYQATLYHLSALLSGIITVAAFSFSGLVRNKLLLLIAPLLLGLSGMNHVYYYLTVTFQMYVVIILLLNLLFWRTKPSGVAGVLFFLLLTLLIWSGPYSVLTVPFALLYIILFRDRVPMFLALIIVAVLYTLTVNSGTVRLDHLFNPYILSMWEKSLVFDIFYMKQLPLSSINTVTLAVIPVFFATVFLLLHRDYFFLKTSLLFLAVIILNYAPFLLSVKIIVYQKFFPCHIAVSQFFWLAFLLFTVDRLCLRFVLIKKQIAFVFCLFAIAFIINDNLHHPEKYRASITPDVPQFLATIKKYEELNLAEKHQQVFIETPGSLFRRRKEGEQRRKEGKPVRRGDCFTVKSRVGDQTSDAEILKSIFISGGEKTITVPKSKQTTDRNKN
jgi:hypothetical protein